MIFDYGKDGLEVNLAPEWNATIIKPLHQISIDNPIEKIEESIKNPVSGPNLKTIVKNKKKLDKICIVASDATRPVPTHLILEALIAELNRYGINDNQIVILIATGLHRESHHEELARILGNNLKKRIRAIDHSAIDEKSLINLKISSDDHPVLINKIFYEADLKILTGYVEPHFFMGFSGGRKSIIPGIAGADTIQYNHSAKNIASPKARFGILKDNPLHRDAIRISKRVGVDFIVNVCINEQHEIVNIASGNLEDVHEKLVNYQLKHIFRNIKEPYDIVVCGNGGYPLDINLYQAVKSMAIGELAVKNKGTIISVNECAEGIGIGQDKFKELIFSGMQPNEIYEKILNNEIVVPDQWEIQILARILMKAEIYVVSNLKENQLGNIGLKYAGTVEEAIKNCLTKYGKDASILILPNGPQILPLLKE